MNFGPDYWMKTAEALMDTHLEPSLLDQTWIWFDRPETKLYHDFNFEDLDD